MWISRAIENLKKFVSQCPASKRGKPLSSRNAADLEKQGLDICEKKRKSDGETIYYKTGAQKEKETKERGQRKEARKKLGLSLRGRIPEKKMEEFRGELEKIKESLSVVSRPSPTPQVEQQQEVMGGASPVPSGDLQGGKTFVQMPELIGEEVELHQAENIRKKEIRDRKFRIKNNIDTTDKTPLGQIPEESAKKILQHIIQDYKGVAAFSFEPVAFNIINMKMYPDGEAAALNKLFDPEIVASGLWMQEIFPGDSWKKMSEGDAAKAIEKYFMSPAGGGVPIEKEYTQKEMAKISEDAMHRVSSVGNAGSSSGASASDQGKEFSGSLREEKSIFNILANEKRAVGAGIPGSDAERKKKIRDLEEKIDPKLSPSEENRIFDKLSSAHKKILQSQNPIMQDTMKTLGVPVPLLLKELENEGISQELGRRLIYTWSTRGKITTGINSAGSDMDALGHGVPSHRGLIYYVKPEARF